MNGYSCGLNGKIRKTSDGGATWTQVNATSGDDYYDVFVGANKTFVVGFEGEVLSSSDNGSTWNSVAVPSSLYAIYFIDSNNGWFCGSSGKTYFTNNGGSTWTQAATGNSTSMRDIFFLDQNTGWVVGYSGRIMKYVGIGTNIEENVFKTFSVFPNPAKDVLVLNHDVKGLNAQFCIYNALGTEVAKGIIDETTNQISIAELAKGVYFLALKGEKEQFWKFIKE
jgi:photosystem II stability/assembly factor-like uncharacterized protein